MNWLDSNRGIFHLFGAEIDGSTTRNDVLKILKANAIELATSPADQIQIQDCTLWDRTYDALISFRENRIYLISLKWKNGAPSDWDNATEAGFLAELSETEKWLSEKLEQPPTSHDPYQVPPHWAEWQYDWGHILTNYDMKLFSTGLFFFWQANAGKSDLR